jgi:sugar phosphate isomerase/epimerase
MFLTGPGESGRRIVVEGIKRLAEASAEAGVMLAIEPFHASQRDTFSFVNSIPDALELLAEADVDGLRLLFDTWHLGDAPQIEAEIAEHASLVACVHVSDRRRPTRAEFDRVLPGEGVLPLPQLFRALGESGYDGYYEVEIFSDDGTFGEALPDSLWALDPAVVAGRARSTFDRVWRDAWPTVPASGESDPRAE